jgi:ribosomal protein S9
LPPEEGALVIKALEIIQAENKRKKAQAKIEVARELEVEVDYNNVSAETFCEGMATEDIQYTLQCLGDVSKKIGASG